MKTLSPQMDAQLDELGLDHTLLERARSAQALDDCPHTAQYTIETIGGALDDHELQYTACRACGELFATTIWFSRGDDESAVDTHVLAGAERDRVRAAYVEQLQEARTDDDFSGDEGDIAPAAPVVPTRPPTFRELQRTLTALAPEFRIPTDAEQRAYQRGAAAFARRSGE